MEIKKYTRLAILLALSVVLSIIESMIPIFNGAIPFLKLGLANTIIVFTLYTYGFKEAFFLSLLRVFLVGMLRTGIFSLTFFFSLGGALFSILIMGILKKINILSLIGVSIAGSLFHAIGQIVMVVIILKNSTLFYIIPWFFLFSIPTGLVVGLIAKELIKYHEKILN